MTASDGTVFGGELLTTAKDHNWVIENHGEEHIKICKVCKLPYFSPKLTSETCHGCWYESTMSAAEDAYMDVIQALWGVGIPAAITQTGGMCLAIQVLREDGYILLTNLDDVLTWDRAPEDGWTLGFYKKLVDEDGEDYDWNPTPFSEKEDMLTDPVKSPETAVALFKRAYEMLEAQS